MLFRLCLTLLCLCAPVCLYCGFSLLVWLGCSSLTVVDHSAALHPLFDPFVPLCSPFDLIFPLCPLFDSVMLLCPLWPGSESLYSLWLCCASLPIPFDSIMLFRFNITGQSVHVSFSALLPVLFRFVLFLLPTPVVGFIECSCQAPPSVFPSITAFLHGRLVRCPLNIFTVCFFFPEFAGVSLNN